MACSIFYVPRERMLNKRLGCSKFSTPRERIRAVAGGNFYLQKNRDAERYEFGFNGQLKDNDIYGEGNAYNYGDREYDPRSIRFIRVDRLVRDYPGLSPYQFASNSPIMGIDIDGLEVYVVILATQPPHQDGHAILAVANFEKTGQTDK